MYFILYFSLPQPPKSNNSRVSNTRLLRVLIVLKVDEGKAPGAPGLLVVDYVDVCQGAILGEHFPQVALSRVQAQAKHPQADVWVGVGLLVAGQVQQ